MGLAIAEKMPPNKRSGKEAPKGQNTKQVRKKVSRSKPFPWKLIIGAVAIIGAMVLLSNPIDPNFTKNGSSAKTDQSPLNSFSLER